MASDALEIWRRQNPYGSETTIDEIEQTFALFDDWEDRYGYLIDLGKALPSLPDYLKVEDHIVRGCQSQVWVTHEIRDGLLELYADSDALIVRGLIALVLAAVNRRPPAQAAAYDIEALFERLDLMSHLSPTRGNGLRALVARIRALAAADAAHTTPG